MKRAYRRKRRRGVSLSALLSAFWCGLACSLPASSFADELDDVLDDLINFRYSKRIQVEEAHAAPLDKPEPEKALPGKNGKQNAKQARASSNAKTSKATATKK